MSDFIKDLNANRCVFPGLLAEPCVLILSGYGHLVPKHLICLNLTAILSLLLNIKNDSENAWDEMLCWDETKTIRLTLFEQRGKDFVRPEDKQTGGGSLMLSEWSRQPHWMKGQWAGPGAVQYCKVGCEQWRWVVSVPSSMVFTQTCHHGNKRVAKEEIQST